MSDLRACLHEGGGPHVGAEVTCGGSPHLSCKHDQIKMRYVTPYKHSKFTGTVLWYYHRAWVTCGVTIGLRVKSGYTFHALPLFYLRVQKFTCVRMYK